MNDRVTTADPTESAAADRAARYVPRMLQQHLADDPSGRAWEAEGTAAFVDVSGFTALSEALAKKGREGAEQITDVIGHVFEAMLGVAYDKGGSLLKFGGDALLLWFDGDRHAERAARASVLMRSVLAEVGRIELPDAKITLRMAQGLHTGTFQFFAVGDAHLELLATGPAWTRLVEMQDGAGADEIVASPETCAAIPPECIGEPKAPGRLLLREPQGEFAKMPLQPRPQLAPEVLARCLPVAVREHLRDANALPEHRPVTIAFIRYAGTDALIDTHGKEVAGNALQQLLVTVERAAQAKGVAFLASDVDTDGGKLILTAGAPKVTGDDEERMLLALRAIVESSLPLPIHIGVNRGAVFAGDIGPAYRRTYTVMGDAVNLAARLMAKAEPAAPAGIYATADVLQHSKTHFETTKLEPFAVKGKTEPVQAWSVGRAQSSKARQVSTQRLPLTGRNVELGVIRKAFASARSGQGRLIEIVGDSGIGKTRLLEALRDAATGLNKQHAVCEAYTASTPYAVWIELLREFMKFSREVPETAITDQLRRKVAEEAPDLEPWLPLIAIVFGLDLEPTPEVSMLAEKNRRAKIHESVARFLSAVMPQAQLIEIDNAHHMDEASAELLSYLTGEIGTHPWLFAVARQGTRGFAAPQADTVVRIELKPLAPPDALRLAQLATQQNPVAAHVLQVVATRSGGNPQFLRDLLQKVVDSGGGIAELPDSAEAATMAQIDSLSPDERAVVRYAAVFGLTFHPRMLDWFDGEEGFAAPAPNVWVRIADLFDEEPDGYMRFRRSLLRDAAYEGLPYKLRRRLHGIVAARLQEEMDHPEEAAGILSLHYFEAGEYRPAWEYAKVAAKNAEEVYAYVEAAGLYLRALEAGRQLPDMNRGELAIVQQTLGDSWYQAGEFGKAADAFGAARALADKDSLVDAELLLKLSHVEAKLGKYELAKKWAEQGRTTFKALSGKEAALQAARASAWCGFVLQYEGRTAEALECAERTLAEAGAVDDAEALGDAHLVKAWAYSELGKDGALPLMQQSLELYQRSGNRNRQADVLANIGAICYWNGDWDEAISYFERGRAEAVKIGDTVGATLARDNVADILIDRGEWAEAESILLKTLPVWKASQYRYYLAACLWYLGRVSLCLGRPDEALARLAESKANFLHVGAEEQVPSVEARIAECQISKGNLDDALQIATGLLARASESNGVARVVPLLERVKGHALLKQGDLWGARDALEASLAAARERQALFEATLTMLSLIELDRLEGVEPAIEMLTETRNLLASRKVRATPPVPLPPG